MKDIGKILIRIILIVLLISGVFGAIIKGFGNFIAGLLKFVGWLFALENSQAPTSESGQIVVRILTWLVSYTLVGLVFTLFKCWEKKSMKTAYWVISTIVSFGLSYLVMLFEQHIVTILIALAIVAVVILAIWLAVYFVRKKKVKVETAN